MRENKRRICFFIALFIWISGMCLECISTDTLSFCVKKEESTFVSIYSTSLSVEVRAEELERSKGTTSIQRISGQTQLVRRTLRVIYDYLCKVEDDELSNKFSVTEEGLNHTEQDFGAVVTKYIHNMDGKKRI